VSFPSGATELVRVTNDVARPFVIDLDSANGTTVNDEVIPTSRYYELKSGDGKSSLPHHSLELTCDTLSSPQICILDEGVRSTGRDLMGGRAKWIGVG
jgi:hypothetical protein